MLVVGLDPGPEESAYCVYDSGDNSVGEFGKEDNGSLLHTLYVILGKYCRQDPTLVIEQIAAMGMAVGAEVFETVYFSGRAAQKWYMDSGNRVGSVARVKRHEVKMHLAGNMRVKDSGIRQILIDRWGGKKKAIGTKKAPGALYGVSKDVWSALAIAVTYCETRGK